MGSLVISYIGTIMQTAEHYKDTINFKKGCEQRIKTCVAGETVGYSR